MEKHDKSKGIHGGRSYARKPAPPANPNVKARRKLAQRTAQHAKAIDYLSKHNSAAAACLRENQPGSLNRSNH